MRTTGLDSKYRVEVSDAGIGIAPEEQEKIFSEFHQAEDVHEKVMGGTGVGLALTRRTVRSALEECGRAGKMFHNLRRGLRRTLR